jgi:hypothetical protein
MFQRPPTPLGPQPEDWRPPTGGCCSSPIWCTCPHLMVCTHTTLAAPAGPVLAHPSKGTTLGASSARRHDNAVHYLTHTQHDPRSLTRTLTHAQPSGQGCPRTLGTTTHPRFVLAYPHDKQQHRQPASLPAPGMLLRAILPAHHNRADSKGRVLAWHPAVRASHHSSCCVRHGQLH